MPVITVNKDTATYYHKNGHVTPVTVLNAIAEHQLLTDAKEKKNRLQRERVKQSILLANPSQR